MLTISTSGRRNSGRKCDPGKLAENSRGDDAEAGHDQSLRCLQQYSWK